MSVNTDVARIKHESDTTNKNKRESRHSGTVKVKVSFGKLLFVRPVSVLHQACGQTSARSALLSNTTAGEREVTVGTRAIESGKGGRKQVRTTSR